jgi:CubicO group peptidase (beta-lactamase class C family)
MEHTYPTLSYALENNTFVDIDQQINDDIKNGFPGAGLIIVKNNKIIKQSVYGYKLKYSDSGKLLKNFEPMQADTMFDLASNTKMYATTYAIMHLATIGKINLMNTIDNYLTTDEFGTNNQVPQVINLLKHDAGFDPERLEFRYPIGDKPVYSDIDFILLGKIIEKITKQPLDKYVENTFYKPLGLNHTLYNPLLKGFTKSDCAATEINGNTRGHTISLPNIRTTTIQGEVHDEKAYYKLSGIAGHAGLFSNLHDMAVLTQIMLNKGGYGKYQFWTPEIQGQFTSPNPLDTSFGLGWRRAGEINTRSLSWFSEYASNQAIGHTGWTGTVTLIDPCYDLAIILLTNKKHSDYIDGSFMGDSFATGQYTKIISLIYQNLIKASKLNL